MGKKTWTGQKELFLKENYKRLSKKEMIKKLGKTKYAINCKAQRLGLKRLRNNGIAKHSKGYIMLFYPNHPFAWKTGYVKQSRLIMEQWLRENNPNHLALIEINGEKYLKPEWDIHHKDGKKDNDNIENLEIIEHGLHSKKHFPDYKKSNERYIWVKVEHPLSQKSFVQRSKLVFEEYLRKNNPNHPALVEINGIKYLKLRPNWVIHHKNGKKDDDRIGNLEILSKSEHGKRFFRRDSYELDRKIQAENI